MANISISSIEEREIPSSVGPRVAGLAVPRLLNDTEFSGYGNVIISLPMIRLSTEDLDSIVDYTRDFYAEDGNSCNHKPGGVDGFGLKIYKLGGGSVYQQVIDRKTKKIWFRVLTQNIWSDWEYSFSSSNPQTIPSTSEFAAKLSVPRTISIAGVTSGSVKFDGSEDVIINTTGVAYVGDINGKIYFNKNQLDFGGSDTSTDIYIGTVPKDGRNIPTAYYFGDGRAEIHAHSFFRDNINIDDLYAPITHDHDNVYSKLGHTHTASELDIQLNSSQLIINGYGGNKLIDYNGSQKVEVTLAPESIGAAPINHGLHVEFDDVNMPLADDIEGIGNPGMSNKVARADHTHPVNPNSVDIRKLAIITNTTTENTLPQFEMASFRMQLKEAATINADTEGYCTVAIIQGDSKDSGNGKAYELAFNTRNNIPIIKIRDGVINGNWSEEWFELYHSGNIKVGEGIVSISGNPIEVDDSNIPKPSTV